MYFMRCFREFWNFQKTKQVCEAKFGYEGFLDFAHEARRYKARRPKCKAVPFLSKLGVTLSFPTAPALYNADNFGMMSIKTGK